MDASRTRHFNPVARNRQYTLNYMRKQILVSWAKCKMFQLIKLFHLKKAIAGHYGVVSDETGRDVKDGSKNLTTREEDGKSVSDEGCSLTWLLSGLFERFLSENRWVLRRNVSLCGGGDPLLSGKEERHDVTVCTGDWLHAQGGSVHKFCDAEFL